MTDPVTGDEIRVADVVQIDPDHSPQFGGCFMVVEELKPSWNGCQGYVVTPERPGARAYYRVALEHVRRIGPAWWIQFDEEEEDDDDAGTAGSSAEDEERSPE